MGAVAALDYFFTGRYNRIVAVHRRYNSLTIIWRQGLDGK